MGLIVILNGKVTFHGQPACEYSTIGNGVQPLPIPAFRIQLASANQNKRTT